MFCDGFQSLIRLVLKSVWTAMHSLPAEEANLKKHSQN